MKQILQTTIRKGVSMKQTAVMMLALTLALGMSSGFIGEQILHAQQAPDPRVADLVQAGKVRVGIGVVTSATWAVKDPVTGEYRGVAMDLARALATRLGVELLLVEYPSVPKVLDGVKATAWDIGFLGIDPARADQVDFSNPYLQVDSTYLVQPGSSIRATADADQSGVRIAVTRNSVEDFSLGRILKRAELIRVETVGAGFDLLQAGQADVLAAPGPALPQYLARLPGSRILEGRFHAVFHAIVIPKGQTGRLAYMNDFIEEAKASGLVERAIERNGLRGARVAPAGNPSIP